jgi:molybdenum cofactor cytidylyltransferase
MVCYLALMRRAPNLCGVILAAGESSRMKRDKALLPWPPQAGDQNSRDTFLSAAIRMLASRVEIVLVVAGKNADELAPMVYAQGGSLVVNPDPTRGQFSSLQTGLHRVLGLGRDAAMITLVDRPPVSPQTTAVLQAAFERAVEQWKWAVVPEYQGKHGHPIVAGREMIEVFLTAPASSSARDLQHAHQAKIEYVLVDDPLTVMNIDTPEQYAALAAPVP